MQMRDKDSSENDQQKKIKRIVVRRTSHEHVSADKGAQRTEREVRHQEIEYGDIDFDEIDRKGNASFGSASAAANLMKGEHGDLSSAEGHEGANGIRRERRKKHSKKARRKKTIIAIVAVIAALIIAAIIAVTVALNLGHQSLQTVDATDVAGDNGVVYDEGTRVVYNGHTYVLNKNMVSIAFMGLDQSTMDGNDKSPGQTDAIMVVAIDSVAGKFKIIAIPRDTMVDVGVYVGGAYAGVQREQICAAYGFGGGGQTSITNTTDAISRVMLGVPMNYYYVLNLGGVGKMADAVGGVTVTALDSIPSAGISEGQTVTLTGDKALTYVRDRDTNAADSAMKRLSRQTQFVKAFANKALEKAKSGSVMELVNLYSVVADNSATNLSANEVLYLASRVVSNGSPSVDLVTLKGTSGAEGAYATFTPDETALKETILDTYYTRLD